MHWVVNNFFGHCWKQRHFLVIVFVATEVVRQAQLVSLRLEVVKVASFLYGKEKRPDTVVCGIVVHDYDTE